MTTITLELPDTLVNRAGGAARTLHRPLQDVGANGPLVIRIRREGLRGPEVATLIVRILAQIGDQIEAGAMVTVTEQHVRMHRLPLRPVASKPSGR